MSELAPKVDDVFLDTMLLPLIKLRQVSLMTLLLLPRPGNTTSILVYVPELRLTEHATRRSYYRLRRASRQASTS